MYTVTGDPMVSERENATRKIVYTTLYDLIAAVDAEIEPGEEDTVAPLVAHLLRAGHAQFLRNIDGARLWTDQVSGASRQKRAVGQCSYWS